MFNLTPITEHKAAGTWPIRLLFDADGLDIVSPATYLHVVHAEKRFASLFTGRRLQIWEPPHPLAFTHEDCARILDEATEWTERTRVLASASAIAADTTEHTKAMAKACAQMANMFVGARFNDSTTQVAKYLVGDHLAWHADKNPIPSQRHIEVSVIAQLSNPDDYEGGEVRYRDPETGETKTLPKAQGTVMAFPSTMMHTVTPITAGERYSLAGFYYDVPEGGTGISDIEPAPMQFELRGETFHRKIASPETVDLLTNQMPLATLATPNEKFAYVSDLIDGLLEPESAKRFHEMMNDPEDPLSLETLTEIVAHLVSEART